ncbi:MAG: cupin domain-containing protein [Firmicutes bacterium]|nr:cupin domain-containing protein [Bacillota bacterium]
MDTVSKSLRPFVDLWRDGEGLNHAERKLTRRLSDLASCFRSHDLLTGALAEGDPVVYEVYENPVSGLAGELMYAVTVVFPGQVGSDPFMTRGHRHTEPDGGEIVFTLAGRGALLCCTSGDSQVLKLEPGNIAYAPSGWAHRAVNLGGSKLIFLSICSADVGHDYGAASWPKAAPE